MVCVDHVVVGSDQFRKDREHLPRGPQTPHELFNWQIEAFVILIDPDKDMGMARRHRLEALGIDGVDSRSHYSGKGTFETVMHWFSILMVMFKFALGRCVFCSAATDVSPLCREVLLNLGDGDHPHLIQHVFGKLEDRLSAEAKHDIHDYLIQLKPSIGSLDELKRLNVDRLELLCDIIFTHQRNNTLFPVDRKAKCYRCDTDQQQTIMNKQQTTIQS